MVENRLEISPTQVNTENNTCYDFVMSAYHKSVVFGVEDTGHVAKEHSLTNLLFSLLSCSFVLLISIVSSTPSKSPVFPAVFYQAYHYSYFCHTGNVPVVLINRVTAHVQYKTALVTP